jgi:PPOX class probable F420-dependent enzyme
MDRADIERRLATEFVARLATTGEDGRPHLVPICFALEGDTLYFAVDFKPKRTTNLKRLRNLAANPAASVLVDHYEEDWDQLWWVRLDGTAQLVTDPAEVERALNVLAQRYEQYRQTRPEGPVVSITIERMTGWSAT